MSEAIENRKQSLRDLIEECRQNGKDAMKNGDMDKALAYQQGQQVYEDELKQLSNF